MPISKTGGTDRATELLKHYRNSANDSARAYSTSPSASTSDTKLPPLNLKHVRSLSVTSPRYNNTDLQQRDYLLPSLYASQSLTPHGHNAVIREQPHNEIQPAEESAPIEIIGTHLKAPFDDELSQNTPNRSKFKQVGAKTDTRNPDQRSSPSSSVNPDTTYSDQAPPLYAIHFINHNANIQNKYPKDLHSVTLKEYTQQREEESETMSKEIDPLMSRLPVLPPFYPQHTSSVSTSFHHPSVSASRSPSPYPEKKVIEDVPSELKSVLPTVISLLKDIPKEEQTQLHESVNASNNSRSLGNGTTSPDNEKIQS